MKYVKSLVDIEWESQAHWVQGNIYMVLDELDDRYYIESEIADEPCYVLKDNFESNFEIGECDGEVHPACSHCKYLIKEKGVVSCGNEAAKVN